jgi:DNA-binding PadR family transcriptional regulator
MTMAMTEAEFDDSLASLLSKGLIKVEYNENLEAMVSITPLGEEVLKEATEAGL